MIPNLVNKVRDFFMKKNGRMVACRILLIGSGEKI